MKNVQHDILIHQHVYILEKTFLKMGTNVKIVQIINLD